MNPIYKLLQSLPTNGWTTAIGGIGLVLFGGGGFIASLFQPEATASACTGGFNPEMSLSLIAAGVAALGIGSKMEKGKQ